jgi:hypothetical protein
VDHNVNLLIPNFKEEVSLDDLERLVYECGGIDRDLLPHPPCGMLERFGHRRRRYALRSPGPEWAA